VTVADLTVVLQGRGVRLEPLGYDHVAGLVAAGTQDRSRYGLTHVPADEAQAHRYVAEALAARDAGLAVPFAVVAGGAVVGSTRFFDLVAVPLPHDPDPRTPTLVEIGHTWLAASAQRSAVNTTMKYLMLTHAFEGWGAQRVCLQTDARNAVSRAAIERLGAVPEGVRRAHKPGADGLLRDSAFYSILAGEWPRVRARLEGLLDR